MRVGPNNFTRFFYFIAVLTGISLAAAAVVKWLTKNFFGIAELPVWVETPSVVSIVVGLYWLFDRYLWAWPIFRAFRIVDFPDLRGRWAGQLKSSYNGGTEID